MKMVVTAFGLCLLVAILLGSACTSLEPVHSTLERLLVITATSRMPDAGDSAHAELTSPQSTPQTEGEPELVNTAVPTGDPEETGVDPDEPGLTPTVGRDGEVSPERGAREDRPLPERIPSPDQPATTGEVPREILDALLDDLVAQTGANRASIQILRAEAVVWSDGSLGCPKPGQFYTQAEVPGYWVVLQVGTEDYDYRVRNSGHFLMCENSFPLIFPPADRGGGSPPER
jgi:hypothetical protein